MSTDDEQEEAEVRSAPEGPPPGIGILRATLAGTALFVVVGALGSVAPDAFAGPFFVVSLVEFVIGTVVFALAYLRAVDRSRTEAIGIGGLFFGAGSTPGNVQRLLLGSLIVQVVTSFVFASVRIYTPMAFGILAPMWALGFSGLWTAAYGTFPQRTPELTRAAQRDAQKRAHRASGPGDPRDRTE